MPASEITRKVYRPSATDGLLYAKVYGSAAPLTPVGNVLELVNEFKEDVEKQDDMIQYDKVQPEHRLRANLISRAFNQIDQLPSLFLCRSDERSRVRLAHRQRKQLPRPGHSYKDIGGRR